MTALSCRKRAKTKWRVKDRIKGKKKTAWFMNQLLCSEPRARITRDFKLDVLKGHLFCWSLFLVSWWTYGHEDVCYCKGQLHNESLNKENFIFLFPPYLNSMPCSAFHCLLEFCQSSTDSHLKCSSTRNNTSCNEISVLLPIVELLKDLDILNRSFNKSWLPPSV